MLFGDRVLIGSSNPQIPYNPANNALITISTPIVFDGTNYRAIDNGYFTYQVGAITIAAGANSNVVGATASVRYLIMGVSFISKVSPVTCVVLGDGTNQYAVIGGNSGLNWFPHGILLPVNTPINIANPTGFAAIVAEPLSIIYIVTP